MLKSYSEILRFLDSISTSAANFLCNLVQIKRFINRKGDLGVISFLYKAKNFNPQKPFLGLTGVWKFDIFRRECPLGLRDVVALMPSMGSSQGAHQGVLFSLSKISNPKTILQWEQICWKSEEKPDICPLCLTWWKRFRLMPYCVWRALMLHLRLTIRTAGH